VIGRTDEPMAAEIRTDVWDLWPWSLLEIAPAACGGAWSETPNAFLWHFQLRAS
jgi:hypothetical protein